MMTSSWKNCVLPILFLLLLQWRINGQQEYVNNKQLACEVNSTNTLGFICNGASSSCISYLTFRSDSIYNSPATIGYALNADPLQIARINNVSDIGSLPSNTLLLIPVNCSCFSSNYYQHNASYVLKTTTDTYFSVANLTYQGLTTCQALIAQNPYYFRSLVLGTKISVPLRCACPTSNQTASGIKYLVSYLVSFGNDINSIAAAFGGGVDQQTILDANKLAADAIIFPFTPFLVPLKSIPTKIDVSAFSPSPPPPISPPPPPSSPVEHGGKTSKKRLILGVGVGAAVFIVLVVATVLVVRRRRMINRKPDPTIVNKMDKDEMPLSYSPILSDSKSWSISAEGVRQATQGGSSSLAVYKLEELQNATEFFSEENRIKGSVFLGRFDGDLAAVKVVNGGEVSTAEINILQQLNHSHIIRLSGFCLHEANAYLVYEYAENGSLSDLLHKDSKQMNWKQRIQIAYDVADALNYLHNYSNPTCIHKNLKSSNILLDSNLRAKISNFGLARSIADQSPAMQITRHVVGTHGYMAPEYIENGLITPQLDVFAFGVVILELLSGREAVDLTDKIVGGDEKEKENEESSLLYVRITNVLGGENVREKLQGFIDPSMEKGEYPLEIVFSLAQLALNCVAHNPNSRPSMSDAQIILSKILSSSLDWDPLDQSGSSEF